MPEPTTNEAAKSCPTNLVRGRTCRMSSARPRRNTRLDAPSSFHAILSEKGTTAKHDPRQVSQMGTPPKRQGVPVCQRSERGLATHPRLRQIQTVSATNAPLKTNEPRQTTGMMFSKYMGDSEAATRPERLEPRQMLSSVP